MSHQQTITNPLGAFKTVSDWRTMKDSDGRTTAGPQTVIQDYLSGGVILVGDVVQLVAPTTAATPPVWTQATTASVGRIRGVSLSACSAAGQPVTVVTFGVAQVNVGAGTPAADNAATNSAGAGVAAVLTQDATAVVGTYLGQFLGAKDANNRAPIFVKQN